MTDAQIVDKSATARSIQVTPPYISRAPFYFTNPTFFTNDQWRVAAREPITRLCVRHIIRELLALEWDITSEDVEADKQQIIYLKTIFENADDGDGWDAFLSRWVQDSLELPMGGIAEIAQDSLTGLVGGIYHVDAATVYPTYDRDVPFVQLDPFNTAARVWFSRGELMRLMLQPRPDLKRKPYQEAPVESAFVAIESLSKMYVYYAKQLGDTPVAGVLDLMDMTQAEAIEWAVGFRELFDGIDPLKIPILYDHTKPAKFISFGRTPQDLNIIEQFKRFAEMIASAFGLSIGDLRLFEHERTLAGVEASQRVTARSGVGFYAQSVEDVINRCILFSSKSGFKFKFQLGMTGEMQAEINLALQRMQLLNQATGNQPVLKPADAQKQAVAWKLFTVELTGLPQPPGLAGLEAFDTGTNLDSLDQDAGAIGKLSGEEVSPLDTIDQGANELMQQSLIGKATLLAPDDPSKKSAMLALDVPSEFKTELGIEQPHMTLLYIGHIDEESATKLKEAMKKEVVGRDSFPVSLTGFVEEFGPPEKKVDAITVNLTSDLQKLFNDAKAVAERAGVAPDATWGRFTPHITLGPAGTADEKLEGVTVTTLWPCTGVRFWYGKETEYIPFRI